MLVKTIGLIFINPLVYILAGMIFLIISKKTRKAFTIFLALFFYLISIGFTSYVFSRYWGVSDTYKPDEKYEAVCVLAGVLDLSWYHENGSLFYLPADYVHSTGTTERILAGMHFLKTKHADKLLFGEWTFYSFNEGQKVKSFLINQGIDENRIVLYAKVNRTIDEAKGVKLYTRQRQIKKLLLVTSWMHMRRSIAMFKNLGMTPDIFSTNKPVQGKLSLTSFVPSWHGLSKTYDCIYELTAYIFYYAKGDLLP